MSPTWQFTSSPHCRRGVVMLIHTTQCICIQHRTKTRHRKAYFLLTTATCQDNQSRCLIENRKSIIGCHFLFMSCTCCRSASIYIWFATWLKSLEIYSYCVHTATHLYDGCTETNPLQYILHGKWVQSVILFPKNTGGRKR